MVAKEVKKAIEKKVKEVKKEAPKPEKKEAPKKEVKAKVEAKPKVEAKKEVKAKAEKKIEPKVEAKKEPAPIKAKEKQDKVADKVTSKAPAKTSKSAGKKGKKKYVLVKAKRKTAIATARISDGKGRVTINKKPIAVIDNKHLYNLVREPLMLTDNFKNGLVNGVDIEIAVKGGGFMSQIITSRGCIAKGLVEYYKDDKLKEMFMKYDKSLLVDDARRKESKKQLGRGARAKKQRSKR
ncbi:MAG: 30S ribosomal protein S9 [Candidatus ainarchaeum sp.]|nr:30S ribosomal protein S9 [Candidatus ainarchaeum sp.]